MKLFIFSLLIIPGLLSACKKGNVKPPVLVGSPVERPKGEPLTGSQPISAVIGPEGGTIVSVDQTLSVIIPAGAVSVPTTFSIQSITNTLEGSKGPSFRLGSQNATFTKPVTLKFSYGISDMSSSPAEIIQVAYQDEKGYYYLADDKQVDTENKTVSVATTHFSDWTVFDQFTLDGARSTDAGGTVSLILKTYLLFNSPETGQTGIGAYIDDPAIDPVLEEAEWALAGEGSLTRTQNKCTYQAPGQVPAQNPVMVSASITAHFYGSSNQMQKLILLHPIAIMGDEFLEVTIDEIVYYPSQATVIQQGNSLFISGVIGGDKMFSIRINATGRGSFPFRLPTAAGAAEISMTDFEDPLDYSVSWRTACSEAEPTFVYSGGQVAINKFPYQQGERVEGSFSGASLFRGGNYCADPNIRIASASFRLIRY